MARLVGVDLPRNKRLDIALTYIYGIGRATALKILDATGIDWTRTVTISLPTMSTRCAKN